MARHALKLETPARILADDLPPGIDHDAIAPYGWCVRDVPEPDGRMLPRLVALTWEELLNPREGEQVVQGNQHFWILAPLADILRRHLERRPGFGVLSDVKLGWGIPGLREPAPDVTVVEGLSQDPMSVPGRLDLAVEGASVRLVIEVISPTYLGQRLKDTEANPPVFEAAGVDELMLVDPHKRGSQRPLELAMWRLDAAGKYREVRPDANGWLLSQSVRLRFRSDPLARRVLVADAETGKRLLSSVELEERAAEEAERAAAAEQELTRLRAELARLQVRQDSKE